MQTISYKQLKTTHETYAGDNSTLSLPCTKMHVRLHIKRPVLLSDRQPKLECINKFYQKPSSIKICENLFTSSQVVTHRHMDKQTDMAKLNYTFLITFLL